MGTKYKIGAVVQHGFVHLLPAFSVIKKIVVVDGELTQPFFILESLDTMGYNEHYHAYNITKPIHESVIISRQAELASFLPMHFTEPVNANGLYVNVKYDTDLLNLH